MVLMMNNFYCLTVYDEEGESVCDSFIALAHVQTMDLGYKDDSDLTVATFQMRDGLSFTIRIDTTAYEELHEIMLGG